MSYVKFSSHRSRERAMDLLGFSRNDRPQSYYSYRRETGKGVYDLTSEQIEKITGAHLVHFTALRGPFDDLKGCW